MKEADQRILVVQTAFLGDVVLVTPLIRALRAKFPGARISFLGTPGGATLLSGLDGLDETMAYNKRGAEKGLRGLRAKAAELRDRFDLAVCAHRSLRTALLLYLAGIPRRIGFANSAFPWLFHERVPREANLHEIDRNLALLGPLGGAPEGFDKSPALARHPAPSGFVQRNGRPRVGICPGSIWPTKRWPAAGFAEVARRLFEEKGAAIYILGGKDDQEAARETARLSGVETINLAGKTSLAEWMGVIGEMDLVVTNDSSPTHIASALSVPVVTVFGPTTPAQGFAPTGVRGRVVEVANLACRPCGEHGSRRCPEGHFHCMERLDPARVFETSSRLMDGDR